MSCSKGTYIRVLCEDVATKLNTYGYMSNLTRTVVGDFRIENSITLDELEKNKDNIEIYFKKICVSEFQSKK